MQSNENVGTRITRVPKKFICSDFFFVEKGRKKSRKKAREKCQRMKWSPTILLEICWSHSKLVFSTNVRVNKSISHFSSLLFARFSRKCIHMKLIQRTPHKAIIQLETFLSFLLWMHNVIWFYWNIFFCTFVSSNVWICKWNHNWG